MSKGLQFLVINQLGYVGLIFYNFRIVNGQLGQNGQNVHKLVEQVKKHVQDQ